MNIIFLAQLLILLFDNYRTFINFTFKPTFNIVPSKLLKDILGNNVRARFGNAQKHPVSTEGNVLIWQMETLPVRVPPGGRGQTVSRTLTNAFRTSVRTMERVVTLMEHINARVRLGCLAKTVKAMSTSVRFTRHVKTERHVSM